MMKRSVLLAAVLAASCGETTPTQITELSFDRPTDMAFGCVGSLRITEGRPEGAPTDPIEYSAIPASACEIWSGTRSESGAAPTPPGQEDLGDGPIAVPTWVGFTLQPVRGTVVLSDWKAETPVELNGSVRVNDADPATPGRNGVSIGEDPIAIATDAPGCKVVTANAGSCDLSSLDIASAFPPGDQPASFDVRRFDVVNASGVAIRAKPAAMVAEPSTRVVGNRCGETASGLLYIAYPSCHLVAAVDASTGQVVSGIQYDDAGVPTLVDGNVTCPDECGFGGDPVMASMAPRPVTLDLVRDPATAETRLVIGAENAPSITLVELGEDALPEAAPTQFALENTTGDLGVLKVSLSTQIGLGGSSTSGIINDAVAPGGTSQFVYAVATDHTVRVVDVLAVRAECDTQIDPRLARGVTSVAKLSCFPVGDATNPPRRIGVDGPGIRFPQPPISVAIVRAQRSVEQVTTPPTLTTVGIAPGVLVGTFAAVGLSNGTVVAVNIDDDVDRDLFEAVNPTRPVTQVMAHQIRDGIGDREDKAEEDLDSNPDTRPTPVCTSSGPEGATGGPRMTSLFPARNVPAGAFAVDKQTELPSIQQLACQDGNDQDFIVSELSFSASETTRAFAYPDVTALAQDETWNLTWEGFLGPVRENLWQVDGRGLRALDRTQAFCATGVEPFDVAEMAGCDPGNGDLDCPRGYTCFVHPDSQVRGVGSCMLRDEADRLANACRDFLTSRRRYTVGTTTSGEVQLIPRRVALRTTPVEGCTSDAQCQTLADYALRTENNVHPVDDTETDPHTWSCVADPLRAPVTTGARCEMRCSATTHCIAGAICQGATDGSAEKTGFCMEGIIPPQACINAPQRYAFRAGEAFTLTGSVHGFVHGNIADADGACVRDPEASPYAVSRLPLAPPACPPDMDQISGRLPDGSYAPNPCTLPIEQAEFTPRYIEETCTLALGTPDNPNPSFGTRTTTGLLLRTPGLNLVVADPTYPGDAQCILDRAGALGNIPLVMPGYQLSFRQIAGFRPHPIVEAASPVNLVRGPTQSLWVLDNGDFLSTTAGTPSTRGRIFRIDLGEPKVTALN